MAGRLTILDPRADPKEPGSVKTSGIADLNHKTVGFVSNEGWKCLPALWTHLGIFLKDQHGIRDTLFLAVPMIMPAPAENLSELASEVDAAIVALAN